MNKQQKEYEIDKEIRSFVSNSDQLLFEDQVTLLKTIINKFILLDSAKIKLGKHDLTSIINMSKNAISNDSMPIVMGKKENSPLGFEEVRFLKIVESTISYLNGKDCFKRQPVIDYTLEKTEEEEKE